MSGKAPTFERSEYDSAQQRVLEENDIAWLQDIGLPEITADSLSDANQLVAKGSTDLRFPESKGADTSVVSARAEFFESFLGWKSEDHKLNHAYQDFKANNPTLIPLTTFIGVQAFMHSRGVDNLRAIKNNPSMLWKSETNVRETFDAFEHEGYDPVTVAKSNSKAFNLSLPELKLRFEAIRGNGFDPTSSGYLLTHSAEQFKREIHGVFGHTRRGRGVQQVADILGWEGDIRHLARHSQEIKTAVDEELMVYARLFARHGSKEFSAGQIALLLAIPLEAHIIATMMGRRYDSTEVDSVNESLSAEDQLSIVAAVVENQRSDLEAKLGPKTLRAYERYTAGL